MLLWPIYSVALIIANVIKKSKIFKNSTKNEYGEGKKKKAFRNISHCLSWKGVKDLNLKIAARQSQVIAIISEAELVCSGSSLQDLHFRIF